MTETELWEWMMADKLRRKAAATLSRPIVLKKWRGHGADPEYDEVPLAAGTRVRVVMASRFGDVGITDDLTARTGYHYRTTCVAGTIPMPDGNGGFRDHPVEPAELLADIEPVQL